MHMHLNTIYMTLAALCTTGLLQAQTLDLGNVTPPLQTNFSDILCDYHSPGPAGTGQLWDFSQLPTNGSSYGFFYADPGDYAETSSFPGATAVQDQGNGRIYMSYADSGSYFHGTYMPDYNLTMTYQNPQLIIPFPCSYGTSWEDSYGGTWTGFSGTPMTTVGQTTGTADGQGDLLMPYGTVNNVLRIRAIDTYSDTYMGMGTTTYNITQYMFYKPGISEPLLRLTNMSQTGYNGNMQDSSIYMLSGGTVGIAEAMAHAIGMEVFPNPARGRAQLVYSSQGGTLQLAIHDATGRVVRSEQLVRQPLGIGKHLLDLSGLPAGLFTVQLTAPNGQQGVKRLVIE